jgi:hypothetical protein
MLALDLLHVAFIILRTIPSIPSFFKDFYHESTLDFVKGFFWIYWEDQVIFIIASVYMLYYFYGFTYVESSLHTRNEIDLVMVYDLFDMLLNSVCYICIYIH